MGFKLISLLEKYTLFFYKNNIIKKSKNDAGDENDYFYNIFLFKFQTNWNCMLHWLQEDFIVIQRIIRMKLV